jgi:hypothetical protein
MPDDAQRDVEGGGRPRRRRIAAFGIITAAMIAVAGTYLVRAVLHRAQAAEPAAAGAPARPPAAGTASAATAPDADLAALSLLPRILYRNLDLKPEEQFGRLALSPLDHPGTARLLAPMRCVRVHFAAGQGLCLEMQDESSRKAVLRTFGPDLRPRWSTPLEGLPSRARVSPDGRLGAVTVFVTGHSYSDGAMSTQTTIVDMRADRVVVQDLEQLDLQRDGAKFESPDLNFWGVTFAADGKTFHATVSTREKTWLVEGDLEARRMRTLRENVECPSRSPDGKRLAFKKRVGMPASWRLHVLDLATLEDRPVAGEHRSIDDQVEWLDDAHIVYKHGPNVYSAAVDGAAAADVFLARASSPAVVRVAARE